MTGIVDFRTVLEDPNGVNITSDNPLPVTPITSTANPVFVEPQNVNTEFRESFETYDTTAVWSQTVASGDIVQLDGNAVAASYLVISKDPLTATSETSIVTQSFFACPAELIVGLSMSQRVLGQECSIEFISTDAPTPAIPDIAISSISQATTTLTVTTSTPHGLSAGSRIGIYGVTSDSRFNYPCLVIAAIVSTTSFTCTAGPGGTIPSITAGPYTNQGYVYYRPSMNYAQEGFSQIFENTSTTNASMYVRSDAGDAYPSGTFAGNQSVTVGSTSSTSAINAAYTYAFVPTNEYRFLLQADRIQFYDVTIDTTNQPTARRNVTQVVPNINKNYKLRFRVTNDDGLTIPTAKIVSAAKSASTTATITTATAHGLTTGDYIVIYGIRDQTNFANLTTATAVASVINSTQFTISFGASATATSYGGMVSRVQGGNIPGSYSTVAIQSATNSGTELTLAGTANWAPVVGDYVNVYGCRDNATGADLGVDGVYKVVNVFTTTLTLIPISTTTLPASFALTNCGGTVIKRTDVRLSYIRLFQYLREKIEVLNKSDNFSAIPIVGNISTVATVTTVSTAQLAFNNLVNDIAAGTITVTATSAAITPGSTALSAEYNVIVTAASGTNQTLDVVVQESDDSGTNWFDVYHFPRITAAGQYRSPLMPYTGNRIRYVRTVAGTSPSFNNSVNRIQSQTSNPIQRQFFDRTIAPNTLSSTTPSFFTEGCVDLNIVVSMGAVTTTPPVLVYEASPDNANWVQVGADITTAASTNNILQISNTQARFSRIRVKTAGTGATLNYVMVKGIGY